MKLLYTWKVLLKIYKHEFKYVENYIIFSTKALYYLVKFIRFYLHDDFIFYLVYALTIYSGNH